MCRKDRLVPNIHTGQEDQEKVIQFYGKEVIPKLKRQVLYEGQLGKATARVFKPGPHCFGRVLN